MTPVWQGFGAALAQSKAAFVDRNPVKCRDGRATVNGELADVTAFGWEDAGTDSYDP